MKESPADQFKKPFRFVILSVTVAVVFAAIGLARFGFTMLLPPMEAAFRLSAVETGLLAMANLAGYLLLSLGAGFITGRFGIKAVIVVSLAAVSLSLFFTGSTTSFPAVLLMRFITGLGSGGANVPAMALLGRWFGRKERGLASGIAVSGTSLGLIVTGLAIPLFTDKTRLEGLPDAWYFLGILAAAIGLIALVLIRENPDSDLVRKADADPAVRKAARAGIRETLATHGFLMYAAVYFLFGFSYIIYATYFTRFLISERGWIERDAGWLWFLVGAASLSSGLFWGFLSDRIGRRRSIVIINLVFTVSYLLFGLFRAEAAVYASAVLFALCSWSVPAVMNAAAADLLGEARAATGFGVMTFAFGIGQALGPFAAGLVESLFQSFEPAFMLAGAMSFCGAAVMLFFSRGRGDPDQDRHGK